MWVTGSTPSLGSWDPLHSLPMSRTSGGDWAAAFPHPDPSVTVQYKYLLRDQEQTTVWSSPQVRKCPGNYSVVDPRARPPAFRVVDAITTDELTQPSAWQL